MIINQGEMLCDHGQFLLNLEGVKLQCLEIAKKLVEKLHTHFPYHGVNEALGIMYHQY
jgi:hypothetical protein